MNWMSRIDRADLSALWTHCASGDTTGIPVRLSDAMELIDRTTDFIVSNQHLQLVDELAASKRFKNIKLLNYVDEYDPDVQKQFAAATYRLSLIRIWSFSEERMTP